MKNHSEAIFTKQAHIPGKIPGGAQLLSRFLPPIPDGIAAKWLSENVPANSWILDPFGASPRIAIEAAKAGYKVLVCTNNPVSEFLFQIAAKPPSQADLQAVFANLASARTGEERIELYIDSLYKTICYQCNHTVFASAFLWERNTETPFARIYTCQNCGDSGEKPTTDMDSRIAAHFTQSGLHRARALDRVASSRSPDREIAREALSVYPNRALHAIFTLINKLDSMQLSETEKQNLYLLLLVICDSANTLWPHPVARDRPRRLTVPPIYREHNLWRELDVFIQHWNPSNVAVPVNHWPLMLPGQDSGICLFQGKIKDLVPSLKDSDFAAVLCALPRPNQAFWTLSALWSGWLWGRETVKPLRGILRRRRFDWGWHANVMQYVWNKLIPVLRSGTPIFGLIGEAEPHFLSSVLVSGSLSGLNLRGISLRTGQNQCQIDWAKNGQKKPSKPGSRSDLIRDSIQKYLELRGEPCKFSLIQLAALSAIVEQIRPELFPNIPAGDVMNTMNRSIEHELTVFGNFTRYEGGQSSLEVGLWWLDQDRSAFSPLSDRIEAECIDFFYIHKEFEWEEYETSICSTFKGLLSPEPELLHIILSSFCERQSNGQNRWGMKQAELPDIRLQDKLQLQSDLNTLAKRLEYLQEGEDPILWRDHTGKIEYVFYTITTAIIGQIMLNSRYPADRSIILVPGSRANLAAYKLAQNPQLSRIRETGWRFVKFRQIRSIVESPFISIQILDELLSKDPLTYTAPQIPLFL